MDRTCQLRSQRQQAARSPACLFLPSSARRDVFVFASSVMAPLPKSVEIIAEHVLTQLNYAKNRPLFVALQGPQGSGKSYTADLLAAHLSAPPHALRVAQLSIDDLYLPHDALVALAKTGNPLWRGRGQPGTHDVELGVQLLTKLKEGKEKVELPRFEKSLFNGEGDRLPMDGKGPIVQPPVDVVLLEGWCTGFYPITIEEVEQRWDSHWREERVRLNLEDNELGTMDHVIAINDALKKYVKLWEFFDVFVQVRALASVCVSGADHTLSSYPRPQKRRLTPSYTSGDSSRSTT